MYRGNEEWFIIPLYNYKDHISTNEISYYLNMCVDENNNASFMMFKISIRTSINNYAITLKPVDVLNLFKILKSSKEDENYYSKSREEKIVQNSGKALVIKFKLGNSGKKACGISIHKTTNDSEFVLLFEQQIDHLMNYLELFVKEQVNYTINVMNLYRTSRLEPVLQKILIQLTNMNTNIPNFQNETSVETNNIEQPKLELVNEQFEKFYEENESKIELDIPEIKNRQKDISVTTVFSFGPFKNSFENLVSQLFEVRSDVTPIVVSLCDKFKQSYGLSVDSSLSFFLGNVNIEELKVITYYQMFLEKKINLLSYNRNWKALFELELPLLYFQKTSIEMSEQHKILLSDLFSVIIPLRIIAERCFDKGYPHFLEIHKKFRLMLEPFIFTLLENGLWSSLENDSEIVLKSVNLYNSGFFSSLKDTVKSFEDIIDLEIKEEDCREILNIYKNITLNLSNTNIEKVLTTNTRITKNDIDRLKNLEFEQIIEEAKNRAST